jgi:hypothetical protein
LWFSPLGVRLDSLLALPWFEYGINDDDSLGVNIYSSKTGAWIFKESEWGKGIVVSTYGKCVFVNGFMHMLEFT